MSISLTALTVQQLWVARAKRPVPGRKVISAKYPPRAMECDRMGRDTLFTHINLQICPLVS